MGLKYTRRKITTASLSYCPYWSDCGTIASYCRAIAASEYQPGSFPHSSQWPHSPLPAGPYASKERPRSQGRAGIRIPLPGASAQPRRARKKGREPGGFTLQAPPRTLPPKTRPRGPGSSSHFSSSLPPWGTYSGPSPTPPAVGYGIRVPTTQSPWSNPRGCPRSSRLPSPAFSGSRRFPP